VFIHHTFDVFDFLQSTKEVDATATPGICIREVIGSDPGRDTGYPGRFIVVPPGKGRSTTSIRP
jgi:hypothetical protein